MSGNNLCSYRSEKDWNNSAESNQKLSFKLSSNYTSTMTEKVAPYKSVNPEEDLTVVEPQKQSKIDTPSSEPLSMVYEESEDPKEVSISHDLDRTIPDEYS